MCALDVDLAGELAQSIVRSDDSVLGVIVSDTEGHHLAYAGREGSGAALLTDRDEIRRLGANEFLGLKLTPRPGQNSGPTEYVAYVYENFKLVIMELKTPPCVVGLKLTRSTNVEYVVYRTLRKYR